MSSQQKDIGSWLSALIAISIVFSIISEIYALFYLYNWFLVPYLKLPVLSKAIILCILTIFGLLTKKFDPKKFNYGKNEEEKIDILCYHLASFILNLVIVGICYLIKYV